MNISERLDRLDAFIREGRVIRHDWRDTDAEGRERACLLAALSPEVGEAQNAAACPASVLPPWLARLTPPMDDSGTEAAWPSLVQRYARVVRRASETLDDAGWRRAGHRALAAIVREAMLHTDDDASLAACRAVVALCERAASGDGPGVGEWKAAKEAAREASWAAEAAWATEATARAAEVARAASWAAEAAWATEATARAAEVAGSAGEAAAWAATRAAGAAAKRKAWDRMSAAVLDAIESETRGSSCGD